MHTLHPPRITVKEQILHINLKGMQKKMSPNTTVIRWSAGSERAHKLLSSLKQIETLLRTQFIDPISVVALQHDQSESCIGHCLSPVQLV